MTIRSDSGGSGAAVLQWQNITFGTDGKYETYQGRQRLKWNDVFLRKWRVVRTPGRDIFGNNRWFDATAFQTAGFSNNDILTAQSRLLESVRGHQFNLAVNAAQGKQTVGMVQNAIFSIGGAIKDLKRGKFESAARRFGVAPRPSKLSEKDIAGRWLELQYGWLPMIGDVYEAAKAYETLTAPPRIARVYGNSSKTKVVDCSESPSLYSCKGTCVEKYRIIYEMTESMSAARSLGLLDPASVVWEVIPYSFVIDWFIPIGDYLENINQIPTLTGRFQTVKTRRFQGSNFGVVNSPVNWTKMPTAVSSDFEMTRTVGGSLQVPKPQFISLPDAMSPSRIWNALALVTQRVR